MPQCTEARASLRESLKLFKQIQDSTESHHFEDLCYLYSRKKGNASVYRFSSLQKISGGNFVKCFAALYISKRDINRITLNNIVDGNALTQYYNHCNILLYYKFKGNCNVVIIGS